MSIYLKNSTNEILVAEDKPLGAPGGEGKVHRIVSGFYQNCCVKIYYPKLRTTVRKNKIRYMMAHKPNNLESRQYKICWPIDMVYIKDEFVGFLMPLAFSDSIQLYGLCKRKLGKRLSPVWQKYDREEVRGLLNRFKLCRNLAIPIFNIHSYGLYVLVDLKPQNVLVTDTGKISVIDLDSIQIVSNGKVLYSGPVATPEYIPPEGMSKDPDGGDYIPDTWDRFSMGVIFYQLLLGLHPYTGTGLRQYRDLNTLEEKIVEGLFPFGKKSKYVRPATPHQKFRQLPRYLQKMFMDCFDTANTDPEKRPTANDWGEAMFKAVQPTSALQLKTLANTLTTKFKLVWSDLQNSKASQSFVTTVQSALKPKTSPKTPQTTTAKQPAKPKPLKLKPRPQKLEYASFRARLIAGVLDAFYYFNAALGTYATTVGFLYLAHHHFQLPQQTPEQFNHLSIPIIAVLVLYWYFPHCEASDWQATLGKRTMGLKVTDLQGNRLDLKQSLIRSGSKIATILTFLVGFLMMFFQERKQALHDLMGEGSLVVKE
ncbi:MAG: RDD family protein [Chitinophagales bacterium]